MHKFFKIQENESYNLSKGIHLASRNMHTAHFSTDTISSSGPNLWRLISDKIKHASILSAFKAKDKSWMISNCSCRLCKILVKDLGFDLEHHEKFFEIPCTKLLYQIETGQFTFVADYLKIRNCYNR